MNRRKFLGALGLAPVTAVVAPVVAKAMSSKAYGVGGCVSQPVTTPIPAPSRIVLKADQFHILDPVAQRVHVFNGNVLRVIERDECLPEDEHLFDPLGR